MPIDTELHKAANRGDKAKCVFCIEGPWEDEEEEKVDVNAKGANDRTALHRAAGANHCEIAEYLLSKGADPNQVDKTGRSALLWAAVGGHAEVTALLLSKGSNPDIATKEGGMTPLMGACEGGRIEVVKALLAGKCDTELTDKDGKTACDHAVAKKSKAIVQAIKESGAPSAQSAACVIC